MCYKHFIFRFTYDIIHVSMPFSTANYFGLGALLLLTLLIWRKNQFQFFLGKSFLFQVCVIVQESGPFRFGRVLDLLPALPPPDRRAFKMTMRVDTLGYLRTFPFLDHIKFEFYLLILLSECHMFIFIALTSINTCWILLKILIKHYTFVIPKHLKGYLLEKTLSHSTSVYSLQ